MTMVNTRSQKRRGMLKRATRKNLKNRNAQTKRRGQQKGGEETGNAKNNAEGGISINFEPLYATLKEMQEQLALKEKQQEKPCEDGKIKYKCKTEPHVRCISKQVKPNPELECEKVESPPTTGGGKKSKTRTQKRRSTNAKNKRTRKSKK